MVMAANKPPAAAASLEFRALRSISAGFRALGISPRSLEDELEAILRQNRPGVLSP